MKIVAIETHLIRVPCNIGAAPTAFLGVGWATLDTLLVRVVTDQGLEGWGEGFGHACCPATRTVVDTQLAPAVIGEDARDIRGLMARLAQRLHLFGRNGPHVYALSALDVALWDIAGKAANLPLWRLLGGTAEEGAWDMPPRPEVSARILRDTTAVFPQLSGADVVAERVGLRPYRPTVRLEAESLPGGRVLWHNYGHGGGGVSLSWGCARDLTDAVLTGATA